MDALAVVVCTIGRPALAARVLAQVVDQVRPGDEICVVDQSGDADHQALLATLPPRVRVVRRAPGLPAARNAGIATTAAPIFVFLDDDVALHPGCLDAHRRAYADPTVGGAVGRIHEQRLRPNARRTTNRVSLGGRVVTRLDRAEPCPIETLKGANMSLRRTAVGRLATGSFDGPFDDGYAGTALLEDADVSVRLRAAGWSLRFVPDAAVDHLHADTGGVRVGSARETERWRFRNTAYFVRKHRGPLGLVPMGCTFAAIAIARAVQWRDPGAIAALLGAGLDGASAGAA